LIVDTTKLSSKGQVIIPKEVRDAKGWRAGDELIVENRPDGVFLRRRSPFKRTTLEEVAGCLKGLYSGPPRSIEEMNLGVRQRARKQSKQEKS
jgi:AbrB family looped-hinge helix DNA binding protein